VLLTPVEAVGTQGVRAAVVVVVAVVPVVNAVVEEGRTEEGILGIPGEVVPYFGAVVPLIVEEVVPSIEAVAP